MLSTNYFVHLFFDYDHDTHYTDTLLALESEAYLWYKLRLNYGFDAVVFFDAECGELKIQTFDGFSKQLAEKKSFFDAILKSPEEYREIKNCCQTAKKDFTAEDLLKITDRKELRGKKIAFVLSLPALNYIYEKSDEKGIEKLRKKIDTPDGKSILVVKIPPYPSKTEEAFLKENAVLPKLSYKIAAALNGAQEPIMDALRRQMREQIVLGYKINDAFNMLMSLSSEKCDWNDSVEELKKQAAYLQLSFNIFGRSLFSRETEGSSCVFVKHRELYERLKNAGFRRAVRSETKRLENKYPGLSVEEALRKEKLLPEGAAAPVLEYDDPIVKNINNLSVSEKFSGCIEYGEWCERLADIKKNFKTFWNKPLNSLAVSRAEFFCEHARKAAEKGDRITFGDALEMLDFCGEQICAGAEKYENLEVILDYGKNIVELSENIFSILRKYDASSIYEFSKIYKYIVDFEDFSVEKKIVLELDKNNLNKYQNNRHTLRFHINRMKSEIKLHRISDEEIEKVRREIEEDFNREAEKAAETEFKEPDTAKAKEKILPDEEEEDIEDFLYETEEDEKEENREIKDENFADKLYGRTLFKDM